MTEPENFEEDLFADLYDDNDVSRTAAAPKPADAPSNDENDEAAVASDALPPDPDEPMRHEGQDDDDEDEVDFNLGGGGAPSTSKPDENDGPSTPPYGTVHRASAKEDG
ncbi:hypothetical protein CDD81_5377 [Ophiocordyceps australis]|uniref:Uncharacterized protein n=1 Tax=Ophiocordyceps australis TaxID=1399860 RepID=A0A2C5XQ13_9HYPO|nr:hypothetical protein CDD81_5377 [Ophiocordyceps australis]